MKQISEKVIIGETDEIVYGYRFKCAIATKSNYYKARNLFTKRKYYAYYLEKAIKDFKNSINISNLKFIRKLRGLSQSELAKKCNISVRSIQAYEQGIRKLENANRNTILKICEVLNCELKHILD